MMVQEPAATYGEPKALDGYSPEDAQLLLALARALRGKKTPR